MTKVFYVTPYGRFIEIQSTLERKKLHRTNYMKTCQYMPPPLYVSPPHPFYIPTSPNFVHSSPPPTKPALLGALFLWLNM